MKDKSPEVSGNGPYTSAFWEEMRGCREAYRRLADCIHEVCSPFDDVLDLGCGLGFVGERLEELGCIYQGVDLHAQGAMKIDLREPVTPAQRWSLVICTETAEHLPFEASDTIIQTVCDAAKDQIVWSAAPPGQAGTDHVNCQEPGFWLQKFVYLGWVPNWEKTKELRQRMWDTKAQHMYCRDNFFVLEPA